MGSRHCSCRGKVVAKLIMQGSLGVHVLRTPYSRLQYVCPQHRAHEASTSRARTQPPPVQCLETNWQISPKSGASVSCLQNHSHSLRLTRQRSPDVSHFHHSRTHRKPHLTRWMEPCDSRPSRAVSMQSLYDSPSQEIEHKP